MLRSPRFGVRRPPKSWAFGCRRDSRVGTSLINSGSHRPVTVQWFGYAVDVGWPLLSTHERTVVHSVLSHRRYPHDS